VNCAAAVAIMALAGKTSAQGHYVAAVARAFWPCRSSSNRRWLAHAIDQQPVPKLLSYRFPFQQGPAKSGSIPRSTLIIAQGCDKRGREFVYQPTHSCDSVGKTAFNRAIRTIFDGSLEKAVAAYLGDPEAEIPSDEPSRLSSLIGQARQKEKLS
jgi:hypothetical protein